MTTIDEAEEIILAAFVAGWEDKTPYQFDNEGGTNISNANPADGNIAWVRVVVRPQQFRQKTQGGPGNRIFERDGLILVQIFTPSNTGTAEANSLGQSIVDIFEGSRFGGVVVTSMTARKVGTDGKWFQVLAEGTYDYDELK